MSKWGTAKLGDIGKLVTGNTPPTKNPEFYNSKDIAFYKPNDLTEIEVSYLDGATAYVSELARPNIRLLPKGSVLVSCIGIIGKVGVALDECTCNQQINAIIPNPDKADSRYLAYCITSKKRYLRNVANAPIVPIINKTQFSNVEIPLPPLEAQKQIAKTLDTAAELLALLKQQLAELDNLIKSTFYDMFGDPETNSHGWETHLLGDRANIVSGITKGRKLSEVNLIPIPYMRVANVQDGHLNLTEIKQLEVVQSEIEKYQLIQGDLLMTEGGDPDKLGRCAIWKGEIPLCIHQNHIFRVRLNKESVLPEYASFLIGSFYGKKYFLKAAKQTTGIATINSKQLRNFPLLIPDMRLQYKFSEMVAKIEEQKALVKRAIDETQYLFDSLMSKYFE